MSDAKRDGNYVPSALGVSSVDGVTTLPFKVDPITGRLLTDTASASGTVTSVSVATANGFAGTVANPTTTPAITISTTINSPVLAGNGTAISAATTTGTGSTVVLQGSPTLTTPVLGVATATSIAIGGATIGSNGLAVTGHVLIEGVTSTGATGTGRFVFDGTPTLITPVLGVATATSINGLTITSSTGTLTITNLKTLAVTQTLTLSGTDSTIMTFPTTSATIARTDAGQTFTGVNVFTSPKIITQISDTNGNVLINIGATASAVNYVKVTNAATGTAGPILAADGETNVDLKVAGKGTGKVHHTTGLYGDVTAYSPTGGGTATLTCQTSNIHSISMPAGNITIAVSNDVAGQILTLDIIQDSVGSRSVTWFSGIKWAGGSPPTLTTTANKIDTLMIRVVTAGSAYYGYVAGQNI